MHNLDFIIFIAVLEKFNKKLNSGYYKDFNISLLKQDMNIHLRLKHLSNK
jgi:hypothetical protein